jgi:acyl carrier protein
LGFPPQELWAFLPSFDRNTCNRERPWCRGAPGGIMAEGRNVTVEVKRIIKEQLDVDEKDIKPESTFIDDLGADSLGLVELVLAFEEAFEIDIPDEDTEKIRSVQDAVDYIEKHLAS